jgi:hypothetical protein
VRRAINRVGERKRSSPHEISMSMSVFVSTTIKNTRSLSILHIVSLSPVIFRYAFDIWSRNKRERAFRTVCKAFWSTQKRDEIILFFSLCIILQLDETREEEEFIVFKFIDVKARASRNTEDLHA